MKKSTKATLLSGLVFPGLGHLSLKQYVRAAVLVLVSLAAIYVMMTAAFNQAMSVVDRINSGEIALDPQAISEAVANPEDEADARKGNMALILFGACWLFGMVDSYRLGKAEDDRNVPDNGGS